jgi:hypothetical protein
MLCYRLLFRGAPISAQAHFKLVLDKHHQLLQINNVLKSCRQGEAKNAALAVSITD